MLCNPIIRTQEESLTMHGQLSTLQYINVITPVLNSPLLLEQTMISVQAQIGLGELFRIRHIIIDGGSSDSTFTRAQACGDKFSNPNLEYFLLSEQDSGMYSAISKGFEKIETGIVCYQNAGDIYHQGAFSAVSLVFKQLNSGWLYGRKASFSHDGTCVSDSVTLPYSQRLAQTGYYGYRKFSLGFFQQESLFFSSDLLKDFDFTTFRRFRLAGDFFLFLHLINQRSGIFVDALLSGHRIHTGQLSENISAYKKEMATCVFQPKAADYFMFLKQKLQSKFPTPMRRRFHTDILMWDHINKEWKFRLEI